jgi:hypothetical protein
MANAPVYYAKNYPSMDIWLNGARLLLIALAVVATARTGLGGVSASVGGVEALISFAGQYAVCLLIGLEMREAIGAIAAGFRVAAVCALAVAAGCAVVASVGLTGPVALLCVAPAPGLAFLWMEGGELRDMVLGAFGGVEARAAGGAV